MAIGTDGSKFVVIFIAVNRLGIAGQTNREAHIIRGHYGLVTVTLAASLRDLFPADHTAGITRMHDFVS